MTIWLRSSAGRLRNGLADGMVEDSVVSRGALKVSSCVGMMLARLSGGYCTPV